MKWITSERLKIHRIACPSLILLLTGCRRFKGVFTSHWRQPNHSKNSAAIALRSPSRASASNLRRACARQPALMRSGMLN